MSPLALGRNVLLSILLRYLLLQTFSIRCFHDYSILYIIIVFPTNVCKCFEIYIDILNISRGCSWAIYYGKIQFSFVCPFPVNHTTMTIGLLVHIIGLLLSICDPVELCIVNQLLLAATLFRDFSAMNRFTATNARDWAFLITTGLYVHAISGSRREIFTTVVFSWTLKNFLARK
jgi:hypothetical protein